MFSRDLFGVGDQHYSSLTTTTRCQPQGLHTNRVFFVVVVGDEYSPGIEDDSKRDQVGHL